MRTIKILALLLIFCCTYVQAQEQTKTSDQSKSINIKNTNGELSITFTNGIITEFIVNDKPVVKGQYSEFQSIIDDFSDEEVELVTITPPVEEENPGQLLKTEMLAYLMNEGVINSYTKYKVQLKRKHLKVNGKAVSEIFHITCLDLFEQFYDQKLNFESEVYFKRSGDKSRSSIKIKS